MSYIHLFFLLLLFFPHVALSQARPNPFDEPAPPEQEILKDVAAAATRYANAIGCGVGLLSEKTVASLSPWAKKIDRDSAEYAVLWNGKIGCDAGNFNGGTHIAIVRIGEGDTFVVDPTASSPIVSIDVPASYVERITESGNTWFIAEGTAHTPKDARCCPSAKVRFTLSKTRGNHWIHNSLCLIEEVQPRPSTMTDAPICSPAKKRATKARQKKPE